MQEVTVDNNLKCAFCDYTNGRWIPSPTGEIVDGYDRLLAHVHSAHYSEWWLLQRALTKWRFEVGLKGKEYYYESA